YLVAHLVNPLTGWRPDGFFDLYAATLSWCAVAAVTAALILGYRLLRGELLVLAAVFIGTPLFWYAFRFPIGTHAFGVLAVTALLFALDRRADGFWIGILWGLAIACRLQHIVLLPAILFVAIRARASPTFWLRGVAGTVLATLPQALAWYAIYGTPFGPLTHGANLIGVTWMPLRDVAIVPVLFSGWHGLIPWAPITVLAIAGWMVAARRRDALATICLLMFAGELFANACLDRYWWGGLSFGPRRFVDLAIPFAAGVASLLRNVRPVLRFAILAPFLAWGFLLNRASISLSDDLSISELFSAAFSFGGQGPRAPHASLAQSLVAIAIIGVVTSIIAFSARRAKIVTCSYLMLWSIAIIAAIPPTHRRAEHDLRMFRIDVRRAQREGPLLDQRQLLTHELHYLERTRQIEKAQARRAEIASIDAILGPRFTSPPSASAPTAPHP
ncbi:MAG TPA: hypothetical protein VN181_06560, partial [Thermoanaerobaculia bacterium]|nr:hypothetical protein [Thermoanaerobaculia bacterium]